MPELSHFYGALADDAGRAALSSPQALRGRADRRARARLLLACAAVVVAVGIAGTAWGVLTHGGGDPVVGVDPSRSASAGPAPAVPSSAAPTRTASFRPPTSIPATALLKLPTANRSDVADADRGPITFSAPCDGTLPAKTQIVTQRNRVTAFHHAGDPGRTSAETVEQNITIWKAGQAEAFMSRLRAAVTACPATPVTGGQRRFGLVPLQGLGDEAFRVETTTPRVNPATEEADGEVTSFATYIRIGTVVTVLDFGGAEGGTTPRAADVQLVTDAAIGPFRAWLRPA